MSETQYCLQCQDEFKPEDRELFCHDDCRYKFWKTKAKSRRKGADTEEHLADLRIAMERVRMEGKKIMSHYGKLEDAYSNWEDRVVAIEKRLDELDKEVGIEEIQYKDNKVNNNKSQSVDFDAIDDMLNGM